MGKRLHTEGCVGRTHWQFVQADLPVLIDCRLFERVCRRHFELLNALDILEHITPFRRGLWRSVLVLLLKARYSGVGIEEGVAH